MKSVREVEEFVLHPNRLRELSQGEIFAISRTIDPKWGLVHVAKASEALETTVSTQALLEQLKEIRAHYQTQKEVKYLDLSKLLAKPGLKTKPNKELSAPIQPNQTESWS